MLEVQRFLIQNNGNFQELTDKFGIVVNKNLSDNRIILNYHQIDSYKQRFHPIICECRGLVLNSESFNVIAKPFNRFFNIGENPSDSNFNWTKFETYEKVDGSLILCYYWNSQWRVNTRNSYGDGLITPDFDQTWSQLVFEILKRENVNLDDLNCNLCYVLELCSRYNKVVRDYPTPQLFHLTTFSLLSNEEVPVVIPNLQSPVKYEFNSQASLFEFLKEKEKEDSTFEGVVVNDGEIRLKIKTKSYLQLHALKNNGSLFHLNQLVPFILREGCDELYVYFPERKDYIKEINGKINNLLENVYFLWEDVKKCSSKKEIAKYQKHNKIPLFNMLFGAYDKNVHPKELLENWEDSIIKLIKKG